MDLDIQCRTDATGRAVIALDGAFDLVTRDFVLHAGRNALATSDGGDVVLDLHGVTFIDSTGIGVLTQLHRLAADSGVHLIIRDPSARVSRILELTGLESVLDVELTTAPGL